MASIPDKYVGGKEASDILGVHQRTLYQWDKKGWINTIRTDGGKRLYNVNEYLKKRHCENEQQCIENLDELNEINDKIKISYVRVSSTNQKDDLERQKKEMKNLYPNHYMIEDIGSGMNLNKKGIRKIIDLAISGKIEELVVLYKDRLTRFGYELIEDLIKKYSNGQIIIVNKKQDMTAEEEIVQDMMQIMNIYVAKMNGMRKYNKTTKNKVKV